MDNVPKEDVVKYGDNVLKDNVVVKKDIVEVPVVFVQHHWDVNPNLVDVINKRYDLNFPNYNLFLKIYFIKITLILLI